MKARFRRLCYRVLDYTDFPWPSPHRLHGKEQRPSPQQLSLWRAEVRHFLGEAAKDFRSSGLCLWLACIHFQRWIRSSASFRTQLIGLCLVFLPQLLLSAFFAPDKFPLDERPQSNIKNPPASSGQKSSNGGFCDLRLLLWPVGVICWSTVLLFNARRLESFWRRRFPCGRVTGGRKRHRWLWHGFQYLKNPVQFFINLYFFAKYSFKVCLYWTLLFVAWCRFGFHKCVSIYVECESIIQSAGKTDTQNPIRSSGENEPLQPLENQRNKDVKKKQ